LALALIATGGVSGLALGGPDAAYSPIGAGPLLALGAPRSSNAGLAPVSLTASERTSPNACASLAEDGRPTSSAAVAVAVTDAVVLPAGAENGAPDATTAGLSLPASAPASGLRSAGGEQGAGSGTVSHPVVAAAPGGRPSGGGGGSRGGGGGGAQVPPQGPSNPPVVDPPAVVDPPTDPPVIVDPPGNPGGDPSGEPSPSADPGPGDGTSPSALPLIGATP
jgi:hypothetical protein